MDTTRGTIRKEDRVEAEKQLAQRASVVKQGGGPDYQFIRKTATTILAEKSKDLRVAGYLCYALWQLETFPGMAEGLAAIEILVKEFWDGLYPGKNRLAARKGALEFLATKLDENLSSAQVREVDRAPLAHAQAALKILREEFQEKMPENPPSLLGLAQAVDKCLNKISRPVMKPVGAPEAVTSPPSHAASEGPKTAPLSRGEFRSLKDATTLVWQAARFMRELNPRSATPYRLVRSVSWDLILDLPPHEDGKTGFEAPPAQDRSVLTGLREGKSWNKLLEECEENLSQMGFHVWLDMQRFAVEALDGLGPDFAAVRAAVIAEVSILLRRLPKLPTLAFQDGTRFADPATAAWIEETIIPRQSSAGQQMPGPAMANGELEAQLEEAKQLFAAGDLAGAVDVLATPHADTSHKARFRRKLAMASFCMRGGQPTIARPLLEELEQDIDRFSIHEWEPWLALEAWTALNKCYETLAAGPTTPAKQALQQRGEHLFERICRLDTSFALASAGVMPASKRPAVRVTQVQQPSNGGDNGTHVNKESTTHPPS
jgi:type VI secretion system protein VasJ